MSRSVCIPCLAGGVYVTLTNTANDATSTNITVSVKDTTDGDVENIVLTETGTNTGVFRNITSLPTSTTKGTAQQDGTLNVSPGDALYVSYMDPIYGDSGSNTAAIQIPALIKQLYLSFTNGPQNLDRIDPVAYLHVPSHASVDLGLAAWPYQQAITILHTKVSNTDQTNFPVLINLTNASLSAHAQASGNDIYFTASDGVTVLPYEREKYTSATGALVAWVKIPDLSHTVDTVIYLNYGNPAATDQQQAANTWNTNFKGVWHLSQTSGTTLNDSTSTGNNATNQGATLGAAGEIGNGITLNGTNAYISTTTIYTNPLPVTISAWFKTTATNGAKIIGFESSQTGTASVNYDRHLFVNTTGKLVSGCYGHGHQDSDFNRFRERRQLALCRPDLYQHFRHQRHGSLLPRRRLAWVNWREHHSEL